MQKYVPGYTLSVAPTFLDNRLVFINKVKGQGDYLPKYAGNLDIINAAAMAVAETYAGRQEILEIAKDLKTNPMEALS